MAVIALDVDGTLFNHDAFPHIGKDIGAIPVLQELSKKGHKFILHTCRGTDTKILNSKKVVVGDSVSIVVDWLKKNDIEIIGIGKSPTQWEWTNSTKPYADFYIDDRAIGAPLKKDNSVSAYPFIDWDKVRENMKQLKLL